MSRDIGGRRRSKKRGAAKKRIHDRDKGLELPFVYSSIEPRGTQTVDDDRMLKEWKKRKDFFGYKQTNAIYRKGKFENNGLYRPRKEKKHATK